jgi:hypothetical protein
MLAYHHTAGAARHASGPYDTGPTDTSPCPRPPPPAPCASSKRSKPASDWDSVEATPASVNKWDATPGLGLTPAPNQWDATPGAGGSGGSRWDATPSAAAEGGGGSRWDATPAAAGGGARRNRWDATPAVSAAKGQELLQSGQYGIGRASP